MDVVGHVVVGVGLRVEEGGLIAVSGERVPDRDGPEVVVLAAVRLDQRHLHRAGEVLTDVERDGVALAQRVRPGDRAALSCSLASSFPVGSCSSRIQGLDVQFGLADTSLGGLLVSGYDPGCVARVGRLRPTCRDASVRAGRSG